MPRARPRAWAVHPDHSHRRDVHALVLRCFDAPPKVNALPRDAHAMLGVVEHYEQDWQATFDGRVDLETEHQEGTIAAEDDGSRSSPHTELRADGPRDCVAHPAHAEGNRARRVLRQEHAVNGSGRRSSRHRKEYGPSRGGDFGGRLYRLALEQTPSPRIAYRADLLSCGGAVDKLGKVARELVRDARMSKRRAGAQTPELPEREPRVPFDNERGVESPANTRRRQRPPR